MAGVQEFLRLKIPIIGSVDRQCIIQSTGGNLNQTHLLYQVDAFTDEPFKGNPAAVCILSSAITDKEMGLLAAEMNLSETAFLQPAEKGWHLRWFTPTVEVDLCGHATLASAKVLFDLLPELKREPIRFFTLSGELSARWVDGLVELDFPVFHYQPREVVEEHADTLGFEPVNSAVSGDYILFEAGGEDAVRRAKPDMDRLAILHEAQVMITARCHSEDYDFISRFFAPRLGILEDPVTGSAHCLLGPYWAAKLGKSDLNAYQASARGGSLYLKLEGNRIKISGSATIIFKTNLVL